MKTMKRVLMGLLTIVAFSTVAPALAAKDVEKMTEKELRDVIYEGKRSFHDKLLHPTVTENGIDGGAFNIPLTVAGAVLKLLPLLAFGVDGVYNLDFKTRVCMYPLSFLIAIYSNVMDHRLGERISKMIHRLRTLEEEKQASKSDA